MIKMSCQAGRVVYVIAIYLHLPPPLGVFHLSLIGIFLSHLSVTVSPLNYPSPALDMI